MGIYTYIWFKTLDYFNHLLYTYMNINLFTYMPSAYYNEHR